MPRTIVLGAGPCGLAAGMMLARDGHRVTVLERDPAPVPDGAEAAWERWGRDGVAQFRQAHFLQARGRIVLDEELPDVRRARCASTRSRGCRGRSRTGGRAPATSGW
jgi:2-polyprenyl-6-methoxyphenol hydroxylase-like FAD-dependent oxidoreductase